MSGFLSNTFGFLNRNKTKLASLIAAGSAGYYIYQYINGEHPDFMSIIIIIDRSGSMLIDAVPC